MHLTKPYSCSETTVTCHECGAQHVFYTTDKTPAGFLCSHCNSLFAYVNTSSDGELEFQFIGYCRTYNDQLS
jgi:transposase-like protein